MNFFPISYSKPALVDAPYCLAVWAFFVNEICTCMRIFIKILVFCFENCSNLLWEKKLLKTLLTAERIWFRCDLYLRFITPMNIWKICIDLRPFSKYFNEPFSRTLRSPVVNCCCKLFCTHLQHKQKICSLLIEGSKNLLAPSMFHLGVWSSSSRY